ncbi:hypothetical protein [Clostridioides difficile]|uniref:hypothetical protein n=3 Tax=Clostridioides difficile TaxID=1496 RepID=UPI000F60997D|nr:hypothetical protein [Clostridioides difficile]MCJ0309057.1 hypothetical protein [Clostridioides difficile]MCJ0376567.1 hypothetical protein [Clostridioides difficile]MCJ0410050.1 hypothetical protein [Clostridioides difficile]MCO8701241.1 hypothetical protein [Clostridioides difficile]RRH27526.1 hypothetical protein EGL90_00585 [Clostridioides difficile]
MLNEDVVKNINKLNNEKDNINLELSKKASKEDLDKLIQGGTNVAISKDISTDDWTIEEGVYTTIVEHNLVTRKVIISLIDKTTNNNVFCSYQILNDNSIKIFNESNNELECIAINGNSAINMISATIDDNRSTETTTYSSVKIEALLKVLENKINDIENLEEVDNIKCSTYTGEYIIENSKKGYLTNFHIEGETLVNLASTNMFTLEGNSTKEGDFIKLNNSAVYINLLNRLNTGIYTLIVNVTDINVSYTIHTILSEGGNKEVFTKSGNQILKLNMDNNIDKLRVYTTDSSNTLNIQMLLLEGDYTDKYVHYFKGLQSVGQGDSIELLSYKNDGNLFNGEFRNGSYIDDGSFYADNNATSNKNFIRVDGNKKYSINYDLDVTGKIFEYDKNKKYIKSTSITKVFSFTTSENTKYINFFIGTNSVGYSPGIKFMFNVGEIKEYERYKFDKKTIPYTLRSLSNRVRDEIVYKNNKYYLIKRCEEVILDGDNFNPRTLEDQNNNIVLYVRTDPVPDAKPLEGALGRANTIYCDKFKSVDTTWGNEIITEGIIIDQNRTISFRILKSKLETQDIEGAKKWMKLNPIKVVYPLEIPEEIELLSLDLQQYNNQTRFIYETSITPIINFESTQNLGSHIEVIRNSIGELINTQSNAHTEEVSNKLLNGWSSYNDTHKKLSFSKNGNVVTITGSIKGGIISNGTIICKIPNGMTPKFNQLFQAFNTAGTTVGLLYVNSYGDFKINLLTSNTIAIVNAQYILN